MTAPSFFARVITGMSRSIAGISSAADATLALLMVLGSFTQSIFVALLLLTCFADVRCMVEYDPKKPGGDMFCHALDLIHDNFFAFDPTRRRPM
jgi:hypothetical protein